MNAYDRALDSIETQAWERMQDIRAMRRRKDPYKGYSLASGISQMAHEKRSGLEFEISQDLERTHPAMHGGIIVPWSVFTRADTVGSVTAGGYLVSTENIDAADALRPNMVCGALGATFIPAPHGANVNLPRQTTAGTATWLATGETTVIAESDQVFGQVAYQPHTVAAYTEFSRLGSLQASPSPMEFVVNRDVMGTVARAYDLAALFGTGINGQPHGLAGFTGVQTFSGTAMSLTSITNASIALADALDDSAGVAANRTTAGLLKTRPESAGSARLLWEGSLIAGSSVGFPAR